VSAAPTEVAVRRPGARRMGFFTDTTVCIGCKACEVACKQWNDLPADGSVFRRRSSYDHTGALSASTWRHVRFVEQLEPAPLPDLPAYGGGDLDLVAAAERFGGVPQMDRWLFMSDVCKHCTNAGCLDACPTGALIRTEFETVIVQPDVCNGCGYCVPSCPFGVIDRDPYDGRAAKCTLCYDRLQDGLEPACAKSCPTDSIQFGPYDELVEVAKGRVLALHERGVTDAYLYGAGDEPGEQLAGELGAFFLLTAPPERFGLPAQAESPAQENGPLATAAGLAAAALGLAAAVASFARAHRAARSGGPLRAPASRAPLGAHPRAVRSRAPLRALRGRR
jgi:formate dehydrogenase iron-sulfur subunit